ncbi:MAG TPA: biopolymer transporter ExbD [Bacteroidales bacterium]|nr:biopolymer transporter ExbD [Bacteroidales bacterium]
MTKFSTKRKKGNQPISTASLPDIIFMLLFFFMVTTVMREVELKITVKVPEATELKKLEKKSLVSYIYVGEPRPKYRKLYGSEPRIQLNDVFAQVSDIQQYIINERESHNEKEIPLLTTSLKIDEDVTMGIVTDIKQELRKINALKINYSARKRVNDL